MKACERCGARMLLAQLGAVPDPTNYALFDYCAYCSKDLCPSCMKDGCCGRTPAASGSDADDASED
jgi:hypothetical protein